METESGNPRQSGFGKYLLYDLFRAFWCQVAKLFFREISERNAHLIPRKGPVIFVVAPHHNQFVDPFVLLLHSMRRVYFLVAAASMRLRFIGFYGRCLHGIPVERQQDLAKPGSGTIRLDDCYNEPTLITGINTKFTTELNDSMKIVLPNGAGQAKIARIVSDTQLYIAKEMKGLRALELLTQRVHGSSYKFVPHIDQDKVYSAVYRQLARNHCIGIFPEGGSHDRTQMLPLKAGVAIMALGAVAEHPGMPLKIVPAGLNYFHPSKFRSRAVIEFGAPIAVPADLVERYKQGGEAKRAACSELLETVSEGLKQVTLNTPDYETLKLIQAGRRLYRPTRRSMSVTTQTELTRRFIKGYSIYRDLPEVKELRGRIEEYNLQLKYYGIRDHQVENLRLSRARAGALFVRRLASLLVRGLMALPGTLLNVPVFVVTSYVSKRKARAALAASTVKVRARDVIATWKILIALVLVPLLFSAYSVVAVVIVRNGWLVPAVPGVSDWSNLRIFVANWALASFMSYTALVFGEQAVDTIKSIQPLFLSLVLGQNHTNVLLRRREDLSRDITELVNELGPHIYPEFSNVSSGGREAAVSSRPILGRRDEDHASKELHDGDQVVRQRRIVNARNGESGVDASDGGNGANGDECSETKRKYSFSPPTPRTMDMLNCIEPMEFLTTDVGNSAMLPPAIVVSESSEGDTSATAAVDHKKGLFDFNWDEQSEGPISRSITPSE